MTKMTRPTQDNKIQKTRTIDFDLFVVLWNRTQNLKTPKIHIRICRWLERQWRSGNKHLLLMAFRACGKSTLVGLFCAWLLLNDQNLRILILAADLPLSRKMVRNIKKIIERHPLTKNLKPQNPDQWAGDMFTINRTAELRDPSVLARSIGANMTGSRADIIICDDVEVPNSCDTLEKRKILRDFLIEIDFVLVPNGTRLYVGTPHHYHSIYAKKPRKEFGETQNFLHGFERLVVPVTNMAGESQWPERFSLQDITAMKIRTGPNKFASQMMLEPVNIANGRLDVEGMSFYNEALSITRANNNVILKLGDKKIISASAFWDPSFQIGDVNADQNGQKQTGDSSVVACVLTDEEGHIYVHDVCYLKYDSRLNIDAATQQCLAICAFMRDYYLPSLHIEINGIGRFLPSLLRKIMAQEKISFAVNHVHQNKSKDIRIIEAFDALLAANALNMHEQISQTKFFTEMRDWRPGQSSKNSDDGIDAVAGALMAEPVRIHKTSYQSTIGHNQAWRTPPINVDGASYFNPLSDNEKGG